MQQGRTVWWDDITAVERAALHPGVPSPLDTRPDLLVIGGGVIGLTIACYCRALGIDRVLVIDAGPLGGGATGGAGGVLAPELHQPTDPPWFVAQARDSLALFAALDRRWDGALDLRWNPRLLLTLDPDPGSTDQWDDRVAHLTPEQISDLLPRLACASAGVLADHQAQAPPLRATIALARRAGTIATGVRAHTITAEHGRAISIRTSAGTLHPGALVIATGVAPAQLLPAPYPPMTGVKGHLVATAPLPFTLPFGIHAGGIGFGPLPGARMLAGGTVETDDSARVQPDVVRRIREHVRRLMPDTGEAALTHAWCCFRPATSDRRPVIDRLPGLDNAWMSVGHGGTGILMAPVTGQALATWIATGRRPPLLEVYRLRR